MNYENSRLLFPNLALVKKEITERFLLVTQAIYRQHPIYRFDDDEAESKILIYPSYANPNYDGKMVRIVTKVGSYTFGLNDTLNNNMSEEILENGISTGTRSRQILQVSMTLLVQAYTEEESSDVADELAMFLLYACRKQYSSYGLVPRNVQVSETDIVNGDQTIYQTAVSSSFDVPWTLSNQTKAGVIEDTNIKVEPEKIKASEPYKEPGVDVTVTRNEIVRFNSYRGKVTIRDE